MTLWDYHLYHDFRAEYCSLNNDNIVKQKKRIVRITDTYAGVCRQVKLLDMTRVYWISVRRWYYTFHSFFLDALFTVGAWWRGNHSECLPVRVWIVSKGSLRVATATPPDADGGVPNNGAGSSRRQKVATSPKPRGPFDRGAGDLVKLPPNTSRQPYRNVSSSPVAVGPHNLYAPRETVAFPMKTFHRTPIGYSRHNYESTTHKSLIDRSVNQLNRVKRHSYRRVSCELLYLLLATSETRLVYKFTQL